MSNKKENTRQAAQNATKGFFASREEASAPIEKPATPESTIKENPQPAKESNPSLSDSQKAEIIREAAKILDSYTPKPKRGRPKKKEEEKLRGYRYNLSLDKDLEQWVKETAWRNRTSITQYINDLIRADMQRYFAKCRREGIDPKEGWEKE